jgi:hypothetical protein
MPDRETDQRTKGPTDDEADPCKFPVSMDRFPVRARKIQGIRPQNVGIAARIDGGIAEKGPKMAGIRKIPCYFPCWQGIGARSYSAESGYADLGIEIDRGTLSAAKPIGR